MKNFLLWLLNAVLFATIGALGYRNFASSPGRSLPEIPASQSGEENSPARVSLDDRGNVLLTLDESTQEHIGLKSARPESASWHLQTRAYGVLVVDPLNEFVLRAPFAGTLAEPPDGQWPALGEPIADDRIVGRLSPRLTPLEQLDLSAKHAQVRADVDAARAALAAAKTSFESKRSLHDRGGLVSDRAFEEARARVVTEQARFDAAESVVHWLERLGHGTGDQTIAIPLKTPRGGIVVEALARPGESVEAGQVLLRTARFSHLLARVEIPLGEPVLDDLNGARIATLNDPNRTLPAVPVVDAALIDAGPRLRTVFLRVAAGPFALRPGMAVVGYLPAGTTMRGVIIPPSAVVRLAGRTWVYVRTGATTFVRRELSTDSPCEDGWFVSRGITAEDELVVEGAAMLVSEELKPQIELEEGE